MEKRSKTRPSNSDFRHQWVSQAAYYKAEIRNFLPSMELNDWLFAENEFAKMLITRYHVISDEDGGMTLKGLQRLAKSLEVENSESIIQIDELVQVIQKATNNAPCFNYDLNIHCSKTEHCLWREECVKNKVIARWK